MPDDDHLAAREQLAELLQCAWIKAAPVSYRDFERLSKETFGLSGRMPSSTVQELVTRHRKRTPKWDQIHGYWSVLKHIAASRGINPDSLGSMEQWKAMHEAALREERQTREAGAVTAHEQRPARVRQATEAEWWHEYSDVIPTWARKYLSLEPSATVIHCHETAVVPSLLQTGAYADAVFRHCDSTLSRTAVSRQVELRMRRQDMILHRVNPPRIWAVFQEGALRRPLAEPAVIRAQIGHLIQLCELEHVTIQVIPSAASMRTALGYPLTLLRFNISDMHDVVFIELLANAVYLHDPGKVGKYASVLAGLSAEALQPAMTARFLSQILRGS